MILIYSALISLSITTGVVFVKKNIDIIKSIRNDWGLVKPFTRVHQDKRKKKPKHKVNYEREAYG